MKKKNMRNKRAVLFSTLKKKHAENSITIIAVLHGRYV